MSEVANNMKRITLEDAEANFEQVLDNFLVGDASVKIISAEGNAVLVSEEVWRGMTETLKLLSIPGVRETISTGMRENIADTATDLDW